MPWASFSMLDSPGGTGCDVPVRGCWVSRDVIVAAVYDCVFFFNTFIPFYYDYYGMFYLIHFTLQCSGS